MSKLVGSPDADKNNPLMAETESLTAPTHMIQTSNEQLARVRGNIVTTPPPVALPARIKRGRPRKLEDPSAANERINAHIKVIYESDGFDEQDNAQAIRTEFITEHINPHIRLIFDIDDCT